MIVKATGQHIAADDRMEMDIQQRVGENIVQRTITLYEIM